MSLKTTHLKLEHEFLLNEIHYDENTGFFWWKRSGSGRILKRPAGSMATDGYVSICIAGCRIPAHHLAWLFCFGEWPSEQIDHRDRNRCNNKKGNLRLSTRVQNAANKKLPSNNKSGARGIRFKKGRWEASCMFSGVRKYLGRYKTFEAAVAAYNDFSIAHLGEFHSSCQTKE